MWKLLMSLTPLTNFEIKRHYQNERKINGVYSINNLSKIKDGRKGGRGVLVYIIDLDEYESIGTNWIALYVNAKSLTCFDSFGVGHVSKQIKRFIRNKNITNNIYRIKAYDSITCQYFLYCLYWFRVKIKR